jgi:hypothetical protein
MGLEEDQSVMHRSYRSRNGVNSSNNRLLLMLRISQKARVERRRRRRSDESNKKFKLGLEGRRRGLSLEGGTFTSSPLFSPPSSPLFFFPPSPLFTLE